MGFLEYAWSIFLEKDRMKTKLLVSTDATFAQLYEDEEGFVCVFPEPRMKETNEEKTATLCGYMFPTDPQGTRQLVSLFRSSIFHLAAHTLTSNYEDYETWRKRKDPRLTQFTATLLEDVKGHAYLAMHHPDALVDMAHATTLGLRRLKPAGRIVNPATRILVSLLVKANTGLLADGLKKERDLAAHLGDVLDQYKEKVKSSLTDEKTSLKEAKLKAAEEIYDSIIDVGTVTETPFFPHTEQQGTCSVFKSSFLVDCDISRENDFRRQLSYLGGTLSCSEGAQEASKRMAETEAAQVYDAWRRQKERDTKMLSRYGRFLDLTRFKSIDFPQQDCAEYLRIRSRCKSEAHRLIESLLVARDALDEDPRKLYGVLDLQEVIQVVASKSPSVDVFMLDENLSKSYSWVILLDASKSMGCAKKLALELFVMLTEVANELLLDPYSWSAFAFNDRLFVIKDPKERYNTRARSRIGGIKFEGATYLPDALALAGKLVKTRNENMRLITVVSDGWPFGYTEVDASLKETLNTLTGGNVSVIGIGAQSRRMESYFRSCSTIYSLRDLTKNFSNLYFEASNVAAEA